jgi:hypothetical protein
MGSGAPAQVRSTIRPPYAHPQRPLQNRAYRPDDGLVIELTRRRELERGGDSVGSLLLLVPNVASLVVEKFFSAGLTRLEAIAKSRPEEIAAVTGIAPPLAKEILELVRAERRLAAADPVEERKRLGSLVTQLADEHLAQERAATGWSAESRVEKRRWRRQRETTLLRIKISLARLGEVDRVDRLESLPFSRKLEELQGLLRTAPSGRGSNG